MRAPSDVFPRSPFHGELTGLNRTLRAILSKAQLSIQVWLRA